MGVREAEKRPLLVKAIAIKEELGNITEGQGSSGSYNQALSSSSQVNFVVFLSTFTVYLGCFAGGNMTGFSSPAQSGIMGDFDLTLAEYSIFVSNYLVGAIFGSMLTGKIADLIGRRGELRVVNLICIIGWLLTASSQGALWLDVGRLLLGFGFGLSTYGAIIYIAEIIPQNIRGAVMSAMLLVTSCGKALFFVIGPVLHWRALALIGIVPFLLQLICLFMIPESPIWLMKIGKAEECEKALRCIRGANADISREKSEIIGYTEYSRTVSGDGILSLFQKKYARCLTIGVGLVLLQQLGGFNGVILYTSSIFDSAGFSDKVGSMAVGTTQILSSILAACFVDRFGRRPLLLISSAGACFGCVLIGLSFLFQSLQFGEQIRPFCALAGILIYMGLFSLGLEGIPMIMSSEIFPVNIKGAAGSIVTVITMGGGWIVSLTFNFMFTWNSSGTFFIFAAICSANVLFIWKMVPETKGRSLEEIQASI